MKEKSQFSYIDVDQDANTATSSALDPLHKPFEINKIADESYMLSEIKKVKNSIEQNEET